MLTYVPVYLNGKHSIKYDSQFKKTATGITLMQVAAKLYRRTYFLECLRTYFPVCLQHFVILITN